MTFSSFSASVAYLRHKVKTSGSSLLPLATTELATDIKMRHGRYPTDIKWAPLKPATIARKGRNTPLHQTGSMQSAVQSQVLSPTEALVFTDHAIAPIQEYGAVLKAGFIPPRPIWAPAARKMGQTIDRLAKQYVLPNLD